MFERFNGAARSAVAAATEQAERLGHRAIGTEHLLLALLHDDGDTGDLLRAAGLTVPGVETAIAHYLGPSSSPAPAPESFDAEALRSIGIDVDEVRARLEEHFGPVSLSPPAQAEPEQTRRGRFGLRRRPVEPGDRPARRRRSMSKRLKKVLELSLRESLRLRSGHIGAEHLLLGLIREGEGLAALILTRSTVDLRVLRAQAESLLRRPAA